MKGFKGFLVGCTLALPIALAALLSLLSQQEPAGAGTLRNCISQVVEHQHLDGVLDHVTVIRGRQVVGIAVYEQSEGIAKAYLVAHCAPAGRQLAP